MGEMLTGAAIEAVARLATEGNAKPVEIGGKEYATGEVHDPRKPEPEPKTLEFSTLQSLCDYAKNEDGSYGREERGLFAHVEGPGSVALCTGIFGEFNQRVTLARAKMTPPKFGYDGFLTSEQFIIALLTVFEPTQERERLFLHVGNLRAGVPQTRTDDGVSQEATVARGIRVERGAFVNPVMLRPYRTFAEIQQPESAFWLRLSAGKEDAAPQVALFECDGGRWRLDAIKSIKAWMKGELGDVVPVYG